MILRKTVLAAGALVALLASASVGSAKPAAPAAKRRGHAGAVQHEAATTLRPHYPEPGQAPRGRCRLAERRRRDVRRADHVDVGVGVLEEGHERRLPGDRLRRRRRADQRADGRLRRQRHADARHGARVPPRAARSCTSRSCSARSRCLQRQGRRLGPELRRPSTIGKIFTGQITKWNDPAIKALNPKANLPDQDIAVVAPLGRLGHDGRVHRLPDQDEPGVGRQARRRRQVVRQDGRLADRARRQGQRRRHGADQPDRGRDRLRRAAVRDRQQARLRQRQEQAGHVHQALRRARPAPLRSRRPSRRTCGRA